MTMDKPKPYEMDDPLPWTYGADRTLATIEERDQLRAEVERLRHHEDGIQTELGRQDAEIIALKARAERAEANVTRLLEIIDWAFHFMPKSSDGHYEDPIEDRGWREFVDATRAALAAHEEGKP